MSQFKTHLLAEDPVVVLIGDNTILKSQIEKMLQQQNLTVNSVDLEKTNLDETTASKWTSAYKIIWLYEPGSFVSENYLSLLGFLKDIKTPITIVSSLISGIDTDLELPENLKVFEKWIEKYKKQTQFIVDSNYYLPKSSFIFGENIIVSGVKNTDLEFYLHNIRRGKIYNFNKKIGLIEMENFVKKLKENLFRPGNKTSILIKSDELDSKNLINLIKKLYDSYHNTEISLNEILIETKNSVPFSIKEELVSCDERKIATTIVKKLPSPKEWSPEDEIEKPDKPRIFKEDSPVPKKIEFKESLTKKEEAETPNKTEKLDETKKIEEPIDLNIEIQRIFQTTRTDKKVNRIRKIAKTSKKITKKSKRKRFVFIGGIGMTGASIGILFLILIFIISKSLLKKEVITSISEGVVSQNVAIIGESKLKNITNFVALQVSGYRPIIENDSLAQAASMVDISKDIQLIPQILLEVDEASKNLFLQITDGDSGKSSELAQILDNKVGLAYEKLSNVQASLKKIDLGIESDEENELFKKYEDNLKDMRDEMAIQQQIQPVLGSLIGQNGRKTYAIVFQNNQELRPTGGFIQAVALLNFDEGILISHKVYSVYELDRKLPGEITPPEDLKKYLGEEKWYLRDSNWSADFPTTSKQIGWFLNKSLGVDVDGVVAVNLFTIKDVLEATGPIELSEYNEIITHKNLFERMEFHSEVVLVDSPDSTDYSVSIFEKLLDEIIDIDREKIPTLLSSLKNSLDDNQMLFSVTEKSEQSVLRSLGWTGSLVEPQCPTRLSVVDCNVDVLAQVEANIGINKANYYLDREVSHIVKIDREKAVHQREIVFENNAKSNSWPKGTYKSYQRFYLDKDAAIDKVLINGSALIPEQISERKVSGFKEIGIRIDVPIQKQVVVELDYSIPHEFKDGFSYVFFNQRQPGTYGDSLKVVFEYANGIEPVLIAPSAEVYGKTISFDTDSENSLFGVEFE